VQLDQLRLQLRRRTEWEALELGRAMLRAWSGPIYRVWCATFLPFSALVTLALWAWPDVSGIVIWWCKPVFDRVLLYVYSQCAFGAPPTVRQVYRALPAILARSGLLAWLTVYRLSPSRSFLLPIWLLERQRGRAARMRGRLLKRRASGHAIWLTLSLAAMGLVLYVSQILVFEALMPIGQEDVFTFDQWWSGSGGPSLLGLVGLFSAVAASVTEPLYIASGFSLYLNRRSELEAWDVEVQFRSLAQRKRGTDGSVAHAAAVALFLLACSPVTAHAQAPEPANPSTSAGSTTGEVSPAKAVVLDVLRDPVFGIERETTEWRLKSSSETTEPRQLPAWLRWIPRVVAIVAQGARYLVLVAAGVALFWLLLRLQGRSTPTSFGAAGTPAVLFGLDVRPDSLPADLVARARQMTMEGDITGALALLYRGALVSLVHDAGVQFKDGDTERDCLRRAGGALRGVELAYFDSLIRSWQNAAYAQTAPHKDAVLGLCDRWPASFAVPETRA
jgi:hypothetical protein